jgi:hypothetical protein
MSRPPIERTPAERRALLAARKRRLRHKKWAAAVMNRTHCPTKLGFKVICGEPLQNRQVNGETVPYCPRCACKDSGTCVDCRKAPVAGKRRVAIRCSTCAVKADRAASREWSRTHKKTTQAKWRRRKVALLADPTAYAASLERSRLAKLSRTPTQRKNRKRYPGSATKRANNRRRERVNKPAIRAYQRERRRRVKLGLVMTHPCVSCPQLLVGRQRKCTTCAQRDCRMARVALAGMVANSSPIARRNAA